MNLYDDEDDSSGGPDAYVEGDGMEDIEFEAEEEEEEEDDGDDDEDAGDDTEADVGALLNGKASAPCTNVPYSWVAYSSHQHAGRRTETTDWIRCPYKWPPTYYHCP